MCAGGRLDAGAGEITFTTELDAPPRLTAFPYADLLRVYLLFSPAGDISIVVNARSAIQTFDGCESSDAARRFLAVVSSHGVATEESGVAAARAEMRASPAQPEPPPMLAATQQAQEPQPSSATRPTSSRNTVAGVACGVGVAILGAALWAGLAYATHYRLSLLGVGIGLGIAFVFKRFGLSGQAFAIVAALLALSGCALGDIGAGSLIVSSDTGVSPVLALTTTPLTHLMNFDLLDVLFYAVAAFWAFRSVVRPLGAGADSDPMWGRTGTRRAWAIGIAAFVAGTAIIASVILGGRNQSNADNGTATGFLVGTCIVGAPNGPSIVNVPCSRTHDARIDTNMSTQAAYCPSGDQLFVPQPPDPSLCLNFRDHNP